jgi:hypothetical protein
VELVDEKLTWRRQLPRFLSDSRDVAASVLVPVLIENLLRGASQLSIELTHSLGINVALVEFNLSDMSDSRKGGFDEKASSHVNNRRIHSGLRQRNRQC